MLGKVCGTKDATNRGAVLLLGLKERRSKKVRRCALEARGSALRTQ
ncbi:hypothetical protein HMPREF3227_01134 [Corynebacterium sp. CMW7794]|nr:hypothetical protein HMPREF0307_00195 [Corynebacterium sp. DNF00584]KXI18312.1 hypothetical protein HMPREF3227_01134 [Corynebacterium sp. CMW7794]